MITKPILKPVSRSVLRMKAAAAFHSFKRYIAWLLKHSRFAETFSNEPLPYMIFKHQTLLLRPLKDVDMQWQYNKIINLRIVADKLSGVILQPGETFSFWKLVGKPTYRKGYLDGITLSHGKVIPGCGGGLCQLTNLIYWMALHTQLTVTERHRHGYDVFPDTARTQPFGSGATCFYPYGDLMIKNTTNRTFQLCVRLGEINLEGEWRSTEPPEFRYEIVEKNHQMTGEYWGGFSRHNELYRRCYDTKGNFITEDFITENHALLMYAPFLGPSERPQR